MAYFIVQSSAVGEVDTRESTLAVLHEGTNTEIGQLRGRRMKDEKQWMNAVKRATAVTWQRSSLY